MNPKELLWSLFGMALVAWFFSDSLRARESAIIFSRQACHQAGMQFLDETVALARLGIRFGEQGLAWRRVYHFEYSDDRMVSSCHPYTRRGKGWVILCGTILEELTLEI
ncbi:DUF3301 domain-containing protein [Gammaproteobacteria bacterium]